MPRGHRGADEGAARGGNRTYRAERLPRWEEPLLERGTPQPKPGGRPRACGTRTTVAERSVFLPPRGGGREPEAGECVGQREQEDQAGTLGTLEEGG